jgi:hypothetical protein
MHVLYHIPAVNAQTLRPIIKEEIKTEQPL